MGLFALAHCETNETLVRTDWKLEIERSFCLTSYLDFELTDLFKKIISVET
jgi:hypothetical protein